MKRTEYCGLLRESHIGTRQTVMGWAATVRDMGGIIFVDLRDREGVLQVVLDAEHLRTESVIAVTGLVRLRSAETCNPKLATGTVELVGASLEVLSEADPLPFQLEDAAGVREDLRLRYRFLDLRRPELLHNLRFRHKLAAAAARYLDDHGFIQVETPMLTKSTPEGARDYLVPSRVHPGTFYALPQSPQIFKQLLMVGGIDKYYQIARCFRDEDLRADRQPEFTQVDMELSFVDQEDILQHLESMFNYLFREMMGRGIGYTFPRITWQESMDKYGSDKPDLRYGLPIVDLTPLAARCGFAVFRRAAENGGVIRAINVKGKADFTRAAIEDLTARAMGYGAKGMAWIAIRPDGELYSVLTKYFKKEEMDALLRAVDGQPGDFILFCADKFPVVCRTLGGLRQDLARQLGLCTPGVYKFVFITDFPEFEWSDEEGRWLAMHHPFTMPHPEDLPYLQSDPGRVRALAYDAVLNGIELGSGSIRIHRQDIQRRMFAALGFSEERIQERFGFMVNAFRYGTPPHGGFAFGLDRLAMMLLQADSLREVVAFPKNKEAACLMTDAPNAVDKEQLDVLGLGAALEERTQREASRRGASPRIDVDRVAALAKLNIPEEEKDGLAAQLGAMVAFANQLERADTAGLEPTNHVVPLENVFREDVTGPTLGRETLLACAPQSRQGCVFVPQVVE